MSLNQECFINHLTNTQQHLNQHKTAKDVAAEDYCNTCHPLPLTIPLFFQQFWIWYASYHAESYSGKTITHAQNLITLFLSYSKNPKTKKRDGNEQGPIGCPLEKTKGLTPETNLIPIEAFSGQPHEDPVEWITTFERAAETNNWTTAERKMQIAARYLKGTASHWYKEKREANGF
ncbi:hypothetical protein Glove_360g195 [Diversispora epigaea]|uniref:Retrotransposon gag domain-containing protein n=1 Tax=Diversispora epigaea TaxID=1348612 RepID=A0A397HF61_9GLOM|nr:hypothetical protein Glove_360g195 [Diversispora epigaea]